MPPITSYSWIASLMQQGRACAPARPGVWAVGNLLAAAVTAAATLAFTPRGDAALWPLAGVATALLTRWGASLCPGVLLGGLASTLLLSTPWPAALAPMLGGALQALLALALLRRANHAPPRFDRLADFGAFVALALGGVLSSLLIGAGLLSLLRALDAPQFWPLVLTHAMTDTCALLLLAPLLAAWTRPAPALTRGQALETAAWLAVLAASPLLLRIVPPETTAWLRFAPTALVLALATRLGLRETSVALVVWFALQRFALAGEWLPAATEAPLLLQQLGWSAPLAALYLNISQRERRAALRAGQASDERYRTLADSMENIVAVYDVSTQALFLSPSYPRVTGHVDETLSWQVFWDRVHPRHQSLARETQQAVLDGESRRIEVLYRDAAGENLWLDLQVRPLEQDDGATRKLLCIAREMTQRMGLEIELESSRTREQSIFANSDVGIAVRNLKGSFTYVNPAFCDMTGFTETELLSRPYHWLLPEDDRENSEQRAFHLVNDRDRSKRYVVERPWKRKDGSVLWVHSCVTMLVDADGSPGEILMFNVDITKRKRAETALEESYQLLSAVIEGGQDAIFVKDRDGTYLLANRAAGKLLGRRVKDIVGHHDVEFFSAQEIDRIRANDRLLFETKQPQVMEKTGTFNRVERVLQAHRFPYLDEQGQVVGVISVCRDVTGERQRAEELRRGQKADAVSRLAGGVAHDFNNILTVILGDTTMAIDAMAESDPLLQRMKRVQAAAERAAKLTQQLLAYSRKSLLQTRAVSLNELLRGRGEVVAELAGPKVALHWQLASGLWPVLADAGPIEQVLAGLVANARDAMPQGGDLTIATANATLADAEAASLGLAAGSFVRWSVRDTGHGMDEATQAKLFEPFFTTKDPGKGTGLGLASAYGIVKQSGGAIHVSSRPGAGAAFDIYLPRAEPMPAEAPLVEPASPAEPACILLVEEDVGVRRLAQAILEQAGYRVLPAKNAFEATTISLSPNLHYDLLLTDVIMPGMNGYLLAQNLRNLRPALQVVFMSGHAPDSDDDAPVPKQRSVLHKPFGRVALLSHVRAALAATAT